MSYSLIGKTSGRCDGVSDFATTGNIPDTSGAKLLVVTVSWYDTLNFVGQLITDNAVGNVYIPLTKKRNSEGMTTQIWYVYNPSTGVTHNFTTTSDNTSFGPTFQVITAYAFADAVASPFDQESGSNDDGPILSLQPGSLTPTENYELAIASIVSGGNTYGVNEGYTGEFLNNIDGTSVGGGSAYKLFGASAPATNPQFSWTQDSVFVDGASAVLALFKGVQPTVGVPFFTTVGAKRL